MLETCQVICSHFGICGGCTSQNVPYQAQLFDKENKVKDLFKDFPDVVFHPLKKSQDIWHYRNKMEFSFSQDKAGNHYLGLLKKKSRVENLSMCLIAPEWMIGVSKAVFSYWQNSTLRAYHHFRDEGSLQTLGMRQAFMTQDKLIELTVSGNPDFALKREEIQGIKNAVLSYFPEAEHAQISFVLRIKQIRKGFPTEFFEHIVYGKDHLVETVLVKDRTYTFKVSPSAFFQPSKEGASLIASSALDLLMPQGDEILLDLYCGVGMLATAFTPYVQTAVGIELNKQAIYDAQESARWNHCDNLFFHAADVPTFLQEQSFKPDVVIVDPPRSGLGPAGIEQVASLSAKKILYVSCNPTTQAQDIQKLTSLGYSLKACQIIDQFPHTRHVENLALLTKNLFPCHEQPF